MSAAGPGGLSGTLTFRHAGSLTPMLAGMHEEFKRRNPGVEIVDIGGGGVNMARDVAGGLECDVYASVDYSNIPNFLMPDSAGWYAVFASTGFVLRYTELSKFASEINADNWIDVIQRDGVSLWRSNPEGDPAGYRSLMVYQLAERHYGIPGLYGKLAAKSGERFLSAANLPERDTGYCFSYSHHLMGGKAILLPDSVNLSNADFSEAYKEASVTIPGFSPGKSVTIRGEPIRIGATIVKTSAHRELAIEWFRFLFSSVGNSIIEKAGLRPLRPVFYGDSANIPLVVE